MRPLQVGRAGRDGQEAQCHLFLDDADFRRLHSLSSSDSVAASSVCAFLEEALQAAEESAPAAGPGAERLRQGRGVAVLAAQQLSRSMDLKMEVMETLLSYLEVGTYTLSCMHALHASAFWFVPAVICALIQPFWLTLLGLHAISRHQLQHGTTQQTLHLAGT